MNYLWMLEMDQKKLLIVIGIIIVVVIVMYLGVKIHFALEKRKK